MAVYSVNRVDHLDVLKEIFMFRICSLHTLLRFIKFYNIQSEIPSLRKPTLDDAWLSGFIDAEGCFMIQYRNYKSHAKGLRHNLEDRPSLRFSIGQNEFSILDQIKILHKFNGEIKKDGQKWVLEMSGKAQRIKLMNYLRKFKLKSHKNVVYQKWLKAHRILDKNSIIEPKETIKLKKLSNNLNKWRES